MNYSDIRSPHPELEKFTEKQLVAELFRRILARPDPPKPPHPRQPDLFGHQNTPVDVLRSLQKLYSDK